MLTNNNTAFGGRFFFSFSNTQMQIKIYTVPVSDNGTYTEELNRFLRSHKILEVENHLVSNQNGASWCFCVKYISSQVPYQKGNVIKKDYKHELDDETFKVFSKLREIRKQLAAEDAIPAYAVATDKELAEIAKLKTIDEKSLLTIKGFGDKKLEKYGKRLMELIESKTSNEKSGESVQLDLRP